MKTHQSQKFEKRVLLVPLPHFLGTGGRRDGPPGVIRLLQQNRGRPLQAAHLTQHVTLNIGRLRHDDDATSLSRGRLRAGRPWRKTKVGESVTAACCVYLWRRNCQECRWWPRCGGAAARLYWWGSPRGVAHFLSMRRDEPVLPSRQHRATQSTTVLGGQILTPLPPGALNI